jgi:hypothetical protein
MDRMSEIARAVLYEGYLLWPYRRSALKNRQRWTFGAVFPPSWSAEHSDDACALQSQVLLLGASDATITAAVRFLQVIEREVFNRHGRRVDELEVGGERHLAWEEATERQVALRPRPLAGLEAGEQLSLQIEAGGAEEELLDAHAGHAGRLWRSWSALEAHVSIAAELLEPGLWRLTAGVRNLGGSERGATRREALRRALVSTHVAWRVQRGSFVSAADPPAELCEHARRCRNVGTWPVLAGAPGDRTEMLSAPIILEDHPRIAPESPGDMFDGGEIDQLLILNILAMSEAEKREMRDSDPRAREILERCSSLGAEELMSLHGTIRELRPWSGA